jgi:hypothetical protein
VTLLPCICRGGGPPKAVEDVLARIGTSEPVEPIASLDELAARRACSAFFRDHRDDPFKIVANVESAEAYCFDAFPRKPLISADVALWI